MKFAGRVLVMALFGLLVSLGASAQLSKGFRGKVLDRDGKPVSGVKVVLVDEENAQNHYEINTDENGLFTYAGLPFSSKGYRITVQVPGLPAVSKIGQPKLGEFVEVVFDMRKDIVVQEAKSNPLAEAKQLYELGDMEGALAKADEAIKSGDADSAKGAMFIRASCLEKLDRTDDAIAAFEAYNQKFPGDVNILGELAKLCDAKGDKAKADAYKKEFAAKGGKIIGQTYNEGVKAFNAGDMTQAAAMFRQAIQEDPNDADAMRELGRTLANTGDYRGAIQQFQAYVKMKPSAPDAAEVQSWIKALEPLAAPAGKK